MKITGRAEIIHYASSDYLTLSFQSANHRLRQNITNARVSIHGFIALFPAAYQ